MNSYEMKSETSWCLTDKGRPHACCGRQMMDSTVVCGISEDRYKCFIFSHADTTPDLTFPRRISWSCDAIYDATIASNNYTFLMSEGQPVVPTEISSAYHVDQRMKQFKFRTMKLWRGTHGCPPIPTGHDRTETQYTGKQVKACIIPGRDAVYSVQFLPWGISKARENHDRIPP